MSEDRLEKALEAIKSESVSPEELASARERVWGKLGTPSELLCAEFQLQFRDYLDSRLDSNRRLLIEDHLSRCTACRAQLAEQRGEQKATVMPQRRAPWWPRWGTWAAAAALVFAALYLGRASIDTLLTRGPRATVASVKGSLYLLPEGVLKSGSAIGEGEVVRTGPAARAVLRLADGSLVDVNERTELSVHVAWSGKVVNLQRGDIIVRAARQHRGYLRVQTRDSLVSVKGTVFAVSAGLSGTVVSVIEGSVAVAQSGADVMLSPGQQAASNPALVSSAQQAVSWSPDAETYIGMLASLANIEKQIAGLPSPSMRTQSRLLQYLPPNTVVYGAVPNLGSTISQVMGLVEQQSAENPAFAQWWNSSAGQALRQLIGRVQTVTYLFGDEIVYGYSLGATGASEKIPMVLAEVQQGKQAELATALDTLGSQIGQAPLPYRLTDTLMVSSDSQKHLEWLLGNLGQGAAAPFAGEIAAHYQRGAGWLLGMDMDSVFSLSGIAGNNLANSQQVKHLFLERRDPQGVEENEMTITFKGPRMGLASFLASSGSAGAAEYLSSDVIAAMYASTREPRQMFEELAAMVARLQPSALDNLARAEATLGVSFANDIAASVGTESAFGVESLSATGPVWVMAVLVNDSSTLDRSIRRLVDVSNAGLANSGETGRISFKQEAVDGRTWNTIQLTQAPLAITWTYDRGYLVAASDRGAAMRALATRNGGSALVWSQAFQQQLSSSAGLHPSGFAWLNTKGAFQGLAALVPNPTLQRLIAERDPILVVFGATTEQICAVSRTRLSGLIMDIMLLQGLSRARTDSKPAAL